jgi:Flp pilus assembly protein TadD
MNSSATCAPDRVERCRRRIQTDPTSATAHLNLGAALMEINRIREAEEAFRRALELRPGYPEALVNLGGVLLARWDFQGCVEANRKAAQAKPELMLAHYNEGLGHLYLGEGEAMVACFQRALELDPQNPACEYYLAVGLLACGAVAESRLHLDAAVAGGFSPVPEFLKALEKAEGRPHTKQAPDEQPRV